ncbi:MAG: IS607 family transposase [Chloroflexi bacterium]|nr:IS607 family transposase [Chloroflexota bacterium]
MKLSEYARRVGVSYRTAWAWYRAGKIRGYQMDTGTIIINDEDAARPERVVVYARVSSSENRDNLGAQAERLVQYCEAKGYQVHSIVKEVGSGVNDNRQKFLALLGDPTITRIVVEHKDRSTRFGFRYLEVLLELQGRSIEVVNLADDGGEDLLDDLVAIVYSFCARLYGQRRAKRKTERITETLKRDDE